MASLGKCTICNKTCYQLEGHRVGPPGKEIVFHKGCFICQNDGCTWKLNLTSYKYCDGKVWCANHEPMRGFSNKNHAKGKVAMDAMSVDQAVQAPKLQTVNEQFRGGNEKPQDYGVNSIALKNAMAAPKLATTNEQVRSAGGNSYGIESIAVQNALKAPKADMGVNEQVRLNCPQCNARAVGGKFCTSCGAKLHTETLQA